ncbi:hypothetical protein K7432_014265 [Basidiobolus ranarum]|uniref:Uncharacterized protein n=1 Tax=Basidiobolus ranarum TaxID=34480 RepID=A0ABR2WI15_9FUNG
MTAYSSFAAARSQSYQKCGYNPAREQFPSMENMDLPERPSVVIHTGAGGTGKRAGNRVLMHLIQMLAARLAGIDRIVFHSCVMENTNAFIEAERLYDTVWNRFVNNRSEKEQTSGISSDSMAQIIMSLKDFLWQNSDPNEKKGTSKWLFGNWS